MTRINFFYLMVETCNLFELLVIGILPPYFEFWNPKTSWQATWITRRKVKTSVWINNLFITRTCVQISILYFTAITPLIRTIVKNYFKINKIDIARINTTSIISYLQTANSSINFLYQITINKIFQKHWQSNN